jgi:hypothetical protein
MKYDYYLHRSGGRVFDYWGGIGTPFRVSILRAYISKVLGYKMTRVCARVGVRRVYIRATLASGAHRNSYKMDKIKNGKYDEA